MSHSPLINVIQKAVLKAAKPLVRDFGEVDKLQISKKGTSNFVSSADIRTEQILIEELSHARKDFGFLTEEGDPLQSDAEFRFVIDPIDGTSNFIHAISYFCMSVAVEKRNKDGEYEPIAGVIYEPIQDELFIAEKGQGATLNGRRLRVSPRQKDTMLATTTPRSERANFDEVEAALRRVTGAGATVRCAGAAALDLAYVAAGRYDGLWYHKLFRWDMAAGMLMVTEAGGTVTPIEGAASTSETGSIIATNGLIHNELQELLSSTTR